MSDKWLIDTEIFIHPFSCLITGPTSSGKSVLLKEILKQNKILVKGVPDRVVYCYSAWQPNYDEFKSLIPNIEFCEGILNLDGLDAKIKNLIIFDDLMFECIQNDKVMNLFLVDSHHKYTSIFFLTQNLFPKGKYAREISININYIIMFKNPRDQLQFETLARQMNPLKMKFMKEAFFDATEKPYGYLFLDLKQATLTKNRIQTGILPQQKRIIYTAKE